MYTQLIIRFVLRHSTHVLIGLTYVCYVIYYMYIYITWGFITKRRFCSLSGVGKENLYQIDIYVFTGPSMKK